VGDWRTVPPAITVRRCPYTVTLPVPSALVSRAGTDPATRSRTLLAPGERLSGMVPEGAGSATVSDDTPSVRSTRSTCQISCWGYLGRLSDRLAAVAARRCPDRLMAQRFQDARL